MNQTLDRKRLENIAEPQEMPMIFGGDALYGGQTNARFRHEGMVGIAYSDGHVNLLPQADWNSWWREQPGGAPP